MTHLTLFATEIVLSTVLSLAILWRLQGQLRDVGRALCDQGGIGADFWIAYFQLMVLIAPQMVVAYFSRAAQFHGGVDQIQFSIFLVLAAQFAGLALVGRAVWRAANPKRVVAPAPLTSP
jgi:hypothetical protein